MRRTCRLPWLFVLMLTGCGSSYEPAKREASPPDSPAAAAPTAPDPAENPHSGLAAAGMGAAGMGAAGMGAAGMGAAGVGAAGMGAAGSAENLGPEVLVGAIQLKGPEGWTRKQPRSQFVAAEFALPKAEGDESDGRLTISIAGGSVEDNVKRWRDQFGGKPEKESQQALDIAGLKVTVVDFTGTYKDQPGPFAPAVERPGYRMLAAIVPLGEKLHFIKAYGPQKTMADNEDAFHAFLQSMQKK